MEPLAVVIDRIVDERPLILKPFDDTVAIPPYLAGCAILGTGEAVPTILPRFLKGRLTTQDRVAASPPGGTFPRKRCAHNFDCRRLNGGPAIAGANFEFGWLCGGSLS